MPDHPRRVFPGRASGGPTRQVSLQPWLFLPGSGLVRPAPAVPHLEPLIPVTFAHGRRVASAEVRTV